MLSLASLVATSLKITYRFYTTYQSVRSGSLGVSKFHLGSSKTKLQKTNEYTYLYLVPNSNRLIKNIYAL